jgi:hypothetical protein
MDSTTLFHPYPYYAVITLFSVELLVTALHTVSNDRLEQLGIFVSTNSSRVSSSRKLAHFFSATATTRIYLN